MTRNNEMLGAGLSLLGGLAAGAALMYLLDPESGERRRHDLSATARDALGKAGEFATDSAKSSVVAGSAALASLVGQAKDLASSLASHAQDVTGAASGTGAGVAGTVSEQLHSLADRATARASDLYDRASARFGHELEQERSYTAPLAIGAGTAALLGAAAVYFLDSEKGSVRRQRVVDLVNDVVTSTGDLARKLGRRLTLGPARQTEYASSEQYEGPEVGRTLPTESFTPQGT
jgi:gas vesicle protein